MANLSEVLESVVYKRLVPVDLPKFGSNQHEVNGVAALREFFATADKLSGPITWHYVADGQDPVTDFGSFTFYDARAMQPNRTEWRLYYSGDFLARAVPGDVLVLLRPKHAQLNVHALVLQQGSTWLIWVQKLFEASNLNPEEFEFLSPQELSEKQLGIVATTIIDLLDIEDLSPSVPSSDLDLVVGTFGSQFPRTRVMSAFAREHSEAADPMRPDETLVAWLEREEQLFLALEKSVVEARLAVGFSGVDDFIAYSLSVHNRRKSRMGFSLQNHLAAIFDSQHIHYEEQSLTEGRNRPDFLFPGGHEYRDESFNASLLVMLGAKSTLKERWRQVLTEANRIPYKHLCTLQPGISAAQTEQIRHANIQLVIPERFHQTYSDSQRQSLWTIGHFVEFVRTTQAR